MNTQSMSMQVNYYIQEATSDLTADVFSAHVIADLYEKKSIIHIHTQDIEKAQALSEHLWLYPNLRFIPHTIFPDMQLNNKIISIGYADLYPKCCDYLVNLTTEKVISANIKFDFGCLIEIVYNDELVKKVLRERYSDYRALGYKLQTIKIA